jgi:hypothetical protein
MVPEDSIASEAHAADEGLDDDVLELIAAVKRLKESKEAIPELLRRRTKLVEECSEIDRFLKFLGYQDAAVANGRGNHGKKQKTRPPRPKLWELKLKLAGGPFETKTLAEVGRTLLRKHGRLHGSKIEELARSGGFPTTMKSKNFQAYLAVSFKRDGGFINLGKNTWRLKQPNS